jgi:hypothetical protein
MTGEEMRDHLIHSGCNDVPTIVDVFLFGEMDIPKVCFVCKAENTMKPEAICVYDPCEPSEGENIIGSVILGCQVCGSSVGGGDF